MPKLDKSLIKSAGSCKSQNNAIGRSIQLEERFFRVDSEVNEWEYLRAYSEVYLFLQEMNKCNLEFQSHHKRYYSHIHNYLNIDFK